MNERQIPVLEKERELGRIIENEIRAEIISITNFERLTNEKMTPAFLNLAKKSVEPEDMTVICKENGDAFTTGQEQEEHISNYYSNLYKEPFPNGGEREVRVGAFLGTIAEDQRVKSLKLTENEKIRLDSDLTIGEFDNVVKSCKNTSAPGLDGFGYKFIKHFWKILRLALFNYANFSPEEGRLSATFKTAKFRLIPKKEDNRFLKNWRPISLLSCFYKVISKVLANRLKFAVDKITLIGQKSAWGGKFCQEVLIDLVDGVRHCRKHNVNGAIVSLDIKKAFDSTNHRYIQEVYKFF